MDNLMKQRMAKLEALREDPSQFPYRFEATSTNQQFLERFDEFLESGEEVALSGRVMFRNKMGKVVFMRATDETDRLQWMVSEQSATPESFSRVKSLIDIGDICGVHGTAFRTKKGEPTLMVRELNVLSKCVRALPEKFHSLKDKEIRYRQRDLDMIMNRDVFEAFRVRSRALTFIRKWMIDQGFDEVETPILQMIYGGAEAAPFKTHVNAVNSQAYLSISPELFLKRFIVGGFHKVFTISKNFRNEGIDATHYPEFTTIESYEAFADYNDVMAMTERLLSDLCVHLHGTTEIEYLGQPISFKTPFPRLRYFDALKEQTGLTQNSGLGDILVYIKENLYEHEIDMTLDAARLLDKVFGATVEPGLVQPTFVIDYPRESSPLCRAKRGDEDLIERFEFYLLGLELANAYSELNDGFLQRERLTDQSRLSAQNEEIPPEPDEDFMRAIEYGMPPTGGLGLGIDRLVMFLTNSESIRDVISFPFMKTGGKSGKKKSSGKKIASQQESERPVDLPTVKMFHQDMYESTFTSSVVRVDRNLVWLASTLFYPFSGGQAGDAGKIDGIRVVDTVLDSADKNRIIHILAEEAGIGLGEQVTGEIDWQRRYRTMRLHSASHVMEYFLAPKKSKLERVASMVNPRADVSKYGLKEGAEIDVDELARRLESNINEFIAKEHAVQWEVDDRGRRTWISADIREPCGGTHVKNTSEIGPVSVDAELVDGYLTVTTRLSESIN